jgi:hypothetical protein
MRARMGILLVPALLAVLAACGNEAPQRGAPQEVPAKAACDTDCVAVWPALTAESTVDAKDGADSKLVALIDESSQAVYGEWPLYYYVGDQVAGDVNGQGVDDEWFAIAADGKLVKKS